MTARESPAPDERKTLDVVLLAALAVLLGVSCLRFSGSLIDDAYIVFRYADHLLAGLGPVFNSGERVEGFTSPLWLVLMTAAHACGLRYETSVTLLGGAFAVAALAPAWALARRVAPGGPALLAPALLALHPGFAMWAVHGLESSLYVLIVTTALWAWTRETPGSAALAGALFGAGFWTRPETPLFLVLLGGLALLRREPGRAMRLAATFAAIAAPLEIARLAYYGSLTPNTFQAKTGGGVGRILFGLSYAKLFVLTHVPLVGACAAAAVRLRPGDARDRRAIDLAVVGIGWSAYVIWIGGDGFPGFRFWLPILPCAGALAARALTFPRGGPVVPLALGALIAGFSALAALPDARLEHDTGREFTARMIAVGEWLRGHAPPGAVIAVNYVGALPYRSGLRTIDMLGLTDPVIARTPIRGRFRFTGHARGNGSSVLDRRPELILMNGVYLEREPMRELAPQLDSEEQIAADPRFRAEYRRVDALIQGPQGPSWFSFYRRQDILIDAGSGPSRERLARPVGPARPA